MFSKLGELKIGEKLIIKSDLGDFVYKVNGIQIVDEDDRTVLVHYDQAILTLTTCYPFNYIGPAPPSEKKGFRNDTEFSVDMFLNPFFYLFTYFSID